MVEIINIQSQLNIEINFLAPSRYRINPSIARIVFIAKTFDYMTGEYR